MEAEIMELLFARLSSFVASPALPVAWPNVPFTPPADHRYLRAQFVPNIANRVTIDSDGPHQHVGLLQVSLYWTKGQGEADPRAVAAASALPLRPQARLRRADRPYHQAPGRP